MNLIVRLLFYLFTVLLAFISGTFFLFPWYSISGPYTLYTHVNHKRPSGSLTNLVEVCKGSPLPANTNVMFLSVTTISNLHDKNITIHTLLWTHPLYENETCPNGFEFVPDFDWNTTDHHWANELDVMATRYREFNSLQCLQWKMNSLLYLPFTPSDWEEQTDYFGPKESSQHVAQMTFDLGDVPESAPVYMQSFLFDFGIPQETQILLSQPGYPIVRSQNCSNDDPDICNTFFNSLLEETKANHLNESHTEFIDLEYRGNRGYCIDNSYCAGMIRLSNSECRGFFNQKKHEPECQFMLHYMIFPKLPDLYSFPNIWTYNVIAFISCMFGWLFAGYYMSMALHSSYLLNYFLEPPLTSLQANSQYDLNLKISGEPFSAASGTFQLIHTDDTSTEVIFEQPLVLDFDSEEYLDSHEAIIKKEFTFVTKRAYDEQIALLCNWSGEFEKADFVAPSVHVLVKCHIPPIIKTRLNPIIISPIVSLCHLLANIPDRRKIVRFPVFFFNSFFVTCLTMAWALVVIFTIMMNIKEFQSFIYSSVKSKPVTPVIFYSLYLIALLAPGVLTIIKPRRFARNLFSLDNTIRAQEFVVSKYKASEAITGAPRVSHVDIDYVVLDEKSVTLTSKKQQDDHTQEIRRSNFIPTPSTFFDND